MKSINGLIRRIGRCAELYISPSSYSTEEAGLGLDSGSFDCLVLSCSVQGCSCNEVTGKANSEQL
jgi:hypothetical protein